MSDLRGATELERMLADLRQEGQHESSGSFTVGAQEKLRKMGDLARANAIRWVFHATQSAVLSGCVRCRLSCSQETASVSWELPEWKPWLDQPGALAQLTERQGETDEDRLRLALMWALAQEPRRFSLLMESVRGGFMLEMSAEGVKQSPLAANPRAHKPRLHLSFEPIETDRRFRRPQVRGAFHSEASFRLAMCPMSVVFDGQELSSGRTQALLSGGKRNSMAVYLEQRVRSILLNHPRRGKNLIVDALRSHMENFLQSQQGEARVDLQVVELTEGAGLALIHPTRSPSAFYRAGGDSSTYPTRMAAYDQKVQCFLAPDGRELRLFTGVPKPVQEPLTLELAGGHHWLLTDLKCQSQRLEWPRVFARSVLTHLGVARNHLLLQQHGMLLDPVPANIPEVSGWVYLRDAPGLAVELTGYQAIHGPELKAVMKEFGQQVKLWRNTHA